jgi:hypothetical protein
MKSFFITGLLATLCQCTALSNPMDILQKRATAVSPLIPQMCDLSSAQMPVGKQTTIAISRVNSSNIVKLPRLFPHQQPAQSSHTLQSAAAHKTILAQTPPMHPYRYKSVQWPLFSTSLALLFSILSSSMLFRKSHFNGQFLWSPTLQIPPPYSSAVTTTSPTRLHLSSTSLARMEQWVK